MQIKWWEPSIGQKEYQLIKKALDDNYPNEGELTSLLEKKLAQLLGIKHAIAATNGTSGIFLVLKALNIGPGDEVIIPDVTFVATANAVYLCGAKPILVDVAETSININPQLIEEKITVNTKAIIPVHVSGRAADIKKIMGIAKKHNLPVIEDATEALLSKHEGKYLGTFGQAGCFSFSPNKTITTGQGGLIVTDNDEMALAIKKLKDHGRATRGTGGDDIHDTIGFNFKFTDLQAAVGLGQMEMLAARTERMRNIYERYCQNLSNLTKIKIFPADTKSGETPQWTDILAEKRDELDKFLRNLNIDCRRYWHPLHQQKPYYQPDDLFLVSTKLCPQALWLPSCFSISDKEIDFVSEKIIEFYKINPN